MNKRFLSFSIIFGLSIIISSVIFAQTSHTRAAGEHYWPVVQQSHHPWTRWWWLGNAVETEVITKLLSDYAEAGIGGVEITPIYGVKGYEDKFIDYLSPDWMSMFRHTLKSASNFGMGVDLTHGTGWPFGGPQITLKDAARRARVTRTWVTGPMEYSSYVHHTDEATGEDAPLSAILAFAKDGRKINLSKFVNEKDYIHWNVPEGSWEIIAIFNGWTGQQVKRAAPGGDGYVMNHFSKNALNTYLSKFDSVFTAHSMPYPRAFYNDSYEVYGANWTTDFLVEFEKRRGYDLRLVLPELLAENPDEKARRIKTDYQETIFELLLNNFTRPWVDWAEQRGALARNQAHGSPGNLVDIYAAASIPETEIFHPSGFPIPGLRTEPGYGESPGKPDPLVLKFSSSAAHITGKPLVSSETATWLGEHFKVALSQVKPEIDQLFVSGINHIQYHGTPYSPPYDNWPGWLFYASTHFAPTNTFWDDFQFLNKYITRSQSLLQSSNADHDILLYFPMHDLWHSVDNPPRQLTVHNPDEWLYGRSVHQVAQFLWDQGYTFDYISDRLLQDVQFDSVLKTNDGEYQVILVPEVKQIPVQTMEKVLDLAENGATVIFQSALPADVPGYGNLKSRQHRLKNIQSGISFREQSGVQQARIGNGRILQAHSLGRSLRSANIQRETAADYGLEFIRKKNEKGTLYFISNLSAKSFDNWLAIARELNNPVLMDPKTGEIGSASTDSGADANQIYLQLKPGASIMIQDYTELPPGMPEWNYTQPATTPEIVDGQWKISFIKGGPDLPADYTTNLLRSWTTQQDTVYSNFSGTAEYSIQLKRPDQEAGDYLLSLGDVQSSAQVYLNGELIGAAWSHPFEVVIPASKFSRKNTLTIRVSNLMANRIAYLDRNNIRWKKFYNINFVNIDYERFDASNWRPMDSGLLGPVKITPLEPLILN